MTACSAAPITTTPIPLTQTPTLTEQPTDPPTETPAPTQTASATTARPTRTPRPTATQDTGGIGTIAYDDLPPQAHDTIRLIERGGPFPYRQDGAVFQNREGILPQKPRGYYHEYTVKTPGSPDRGARRIVTGEAEEMYYTDDHYDSFRLIVR
jgi:ribonuclease T1